MASCGRITDAVEDGPPPYCGWCMNAPCVGDNCPSLDDEADWDDGCRGVCDECGSPLYEWDVGHLCERCAWLDRDSEPEDYEP